VIRHTTISRHCWTLYKIHTSNISRRHSRTLYKTHSIRISHHHCRTLKKHTEQLAWAITTLIKDKKWPFLSTSYWFIKEFFSSK
jgi:hypothetical protein